jgi:trehalose 6-phosphate phosphatase
MVIVESIPALPADAAVFLDFDGTLVEITSEPGKVVVPPALKQTLARLVARCDGAVAVVSGRRLGELDRFLRPLRLPAAGVHGLERRRPDGSIERIAPPRWLARLLPEIDAFARAWPGVLVEKKRLSVSVHYRGAPEAAVAVDDFIAARAAALGGRAAVQRGKMVVELRPTGHDKGTAIEAFMRDPPFRDRRPVFLGDDLTDEHGFAVVNRLGGLSIRIGSAGPESAAVWTLPSVVAVRRWLEASLGLEGSPAGSGP